MPTLFDPNLRAQRRERAFRQGAETFLHDRAFDDVLGRLELIDRRFEKAVLIGCLNPQWPELLRTSVDELEVFDPSASVAAAASGHFGFEPELPLQASSYDLVISLGTLDTIDALPETLARFRFALRPGGLVIGAMAGGDSVPLLRGAMAQADSVNGTAKPHTHPRIDPASLTQLLANAGLAMPVVDVDAVTVRYSSFERLIADLRGMGATNILSQRPAKPLNRREAQAAQDYFAAQAAADGKSEERFDILHFMGWAPDLPQNGN